MALQKTLPTQYGIDANYWRIISIFTGYSTDNKIVVVELRGWVTKSDMDADYEPLGSETMVYGPEDIDLDDETVISVTKPIMYSMIVLPTVVNGISTPSIFDGAVEVE